MHRFDFQFRPLVESDLPLLCDWLSRSHLQQWWREGELSLETIREKYLPRIRGADDARPFLALLDGQPGGSIPCGYIPCGYIQYYDAAAGNPDWWPDVPGRGVLGIDQFLADGDRLGQGLGTAMVSQFTARLFDRALPMHPGMTDINVTEIRVDPRPDNLRAIRCYAKVGFREAGRITTPDGPALMMVLAAPTLGRNPVPHARTAP